MALILPPFAFQHHDCNLALGSSPSATSFGSSVTAGANDVDGATTNVTFATSGTTLDFDVHYVILGLSNFGVSTGAGSSLDFMVDPAGGTSYASLIRTLQCGSGAAAASGVTGVPVWFHFPIYIKAGSSIGLVARTAHTSDISGLAVIHVFGDPLRPDQWWCGTKAETVGITAGSSIGTSFTSGNSGAWGTWTDIATPTANWGAIQLSINPTGSATNALAYFVQMGIGSAVIPGTPPLLFNTSTSEQVAWPSPNLPTFIHAPNSGNLQVRGKCSGTAQALRAAFHGVY